MYKQGFIGYGNMGSAILNGFLNVGIDRESLMVYDIDSSKLSDITVNVGKSIKEVVDFSDIIWLCVKPKDFKNVLNDIASLDVSIGSKTFVSIAAGITISFIEEHLRKGYSDKDIRIIRIMPNTPALVGEGAFGITSNPEVSEEVFNFVFSLLNKIGYAVRVDESLMDAITALSGSGPAFVFLFINAMIDAGVRVGIPRDIATSLVLKTIKGSIKLMEDGKKNPYDLIGMVTSPGGTTIEGIYNLHKGGFFSSVMDAIFEAYRRSKELGKK